MALDPSISLHAGQNVPQIDIAGAVLKGANLKKLATELKYQEPLLQQQMQERAAGIAATEEGTRQGVQKREEEARKIASKKRLSELYGNKQFFDMKTGKRDHRAIYEAALGDPLIDPDTLIATRQAAQTVTSADLTDTETRQKAKQNLLRQLDMEVPKSRGVDDTKRLVGTKMQELMKLGMTQEEAQQELASRLGTDIENAPKFAQARLDAEMTPLKTAELQIAQANLGIAQAAEGRAKREEVRGVGAGMEGSKSAVADLDTAITGLDTLNKKFPTKLGTMLNQGWDKLIAQPGEMGAIARTAQAYEKRTGLKLDVNTLGYSGVRAALAGEKKFYQGQLGAQSAGAPAAIKDKPPEKLIAGKTTKTYKGDTYIYVGGDEFSQSSWKKK